MVIYPGDWEIDRIKNLVQVITPSVKIKTTDYLTVGRYPVIDQGQKFISGYTNESSVFAPNEYVVFGEHTCIVKYVNFAFAQGADGIKVLTAKTNRIIPKYLYYCMSSIKLDASYSRHWLKMREQEIPLPTLKEQTAIAETLAAFDTHITNLTELITKKKAIRDSALDELMTGRTRLKGFCGDWEVKRLLDCVRLVQGLTYAPNNVNSYSTLVLRSSNIQDNSLSLEDNVYVNMQIAQEKMIQEGDILVCVRNGSSDLIGKSCRLPALSNTTFGAFMSVLRGDKTGYIAKIFNSLIVQKQVRNRTSATINQITKKDFEDIIIPLPPLDEQIAIADTLSALDKEISSLETERAKISQIRDGAMNDLLTGKVRLKIGI